MVQAFELGYQLAQLKVIPSQQWALAARQFGNIPEILAFLRQQRAHWDDSQPALTPYQCRCIESRLHCQLRDLDRDLRLGNYLILDRLGSGGMAEVHKAWSPDFGFVAIKRILAASSQESRDRLEREAAILRLLDDSRIAHYVDFESIMDGSGCFLAMEYVEGQTLRDKLRDCKRLSQSEAVSITVELLRVLEHVHSKGVIHRDIKPGNVILTPKGKHTVKLLDFGLGKVIGSHSRNIPEIQSQIAVTQTNSALGTAPYMPPEQFRDVANVGFPADIYSLGVCFYEMLAGRPPFEKTQFSAVMLQHMTEEPPDIRLLCEGIPDSVARAVHQMLGKKEAGRGDPTTLISLLAAGAQTSVPQPHTLKINPPSVNPPPAPSMPVPSLSEQPPRFLLHPAVIRHRFLFRPSNLAAASRFVDPVPTPADVLSGLHRGLWCLAGLLLFMGLFRALLMHFG